MATPTARREHSRPRSARKAKPEATVKVRTASETTATQGTVRYREASKADKRERIKAAARTLFTDGFDGTTLRQIALQAGVALGTLSLYAKDKRDLILLMFNDEIAGMIADAAATVRDDRPFIDNALHFFRVFYSGFGKNVNLARTYLQQNFFSHGLNTEARTKNQNAMVESIRTMVDIAKRRGEIRSEESSDVIAQSLFLMYVAAVRWWIALDKPVPRDGIAHLARLLALQFNGLQANNPLPAFPLLADRSGPCQFRRGG
jgi:AcrR family transcriptional regulator